MTIKNKTKQKNIEKTLKYNHVLKSGKMLKIYVIKIVFTHSN